MFPRDLVKQFVVLHLQVSSITVRGPRYWQQQLDRSSAAGASSYSGINTPSSSASAAFKQPHTHPANALSVTPAHLATGHALLTPMLAAGFPAAIAGRQHHTLDPSSTSAFVHPHNAGHHRSTTQGTPSHSHSHTHSAPAAVTRTGSSAPGPGAACGDESVRDGRSDVCASSDGVSSLERTYSQHLLFVKKKCSSLSYADDPSGIRSLLSRTFHTRRPAAVRAAADRSSTSRPGQLFESFAAEDNDVDGEVGEAEDDSPMDDSPTVVTGVEGGGGTGLDVANLCATFSLDPFLTAFAQHVQQLVVLQGERAGEGQWTGSAVQLPTVADVMGVREGKSGQRPHTAALTVLDS